MSNIRFQNALKRIPQATPPIWMMRQAGRYHRHYQALREKHDFMELCKQPELAAEVAAGPIRDFDFDVAILFSDLLFPLEALGLGLSYEPAPRIHKALNGSTIKALRPLDQAIAHMHFQKQAVQCTRDLLSKDKSLIGFVGGPWTLFTYAVESEHKGHLVQSKTNRPLYRQFAEALVPLLKENIRLQLEGGAEAVMIFDTAAGEISAEFFRTEIEGHLLELGKAHPGRLGYYSKGTNEDHLEGLLPIQQFAGFGFDHRWSLARRLRESNAGFVQGNFDQSLLFAASDEFKTILDNYLRPFQNLSHEARAGWICGLGHGVLPKTPETNVRRFVERVREVLK